MHGAMEPLVRKNSADYLSPDIPEEEEEDDLPPIDETAQLILPEDYDTRWHLEDEINSIPDVERMMERKDGALTLWSLVGIMYFASSGGPEGTEGVVSAMGPGGALLGIALAALLWSSPIALMSAEMGTAVPENGGAMVWARAAFGAGTFMGDGIAFLAGWMSFLFTAVDAALYPSMFVSYLSAGTDVDMSPNMLLYIKMVFVLALVGHNCFGVAAVGEGSKVMIVLLLAPFIAFITCSFTGLNGMPFDPSTWGVINPDTQVGDSVLLLAWNMGMWEAAASCAGEVREPGKTFPKALAIVVALVVINYMLPIMAFTAVDGDWKSYENGCYVGIASKYGGKIFGSCIALGQCVSTTGLFENGLVKNSYTLAGMAEQTLLPAIFKYRWPTTGAFIFAIFASSVVTGTMVFLSDFSAILGVDMLLYCALLCVEIASFVSLRIHHAEVTRSFRVPINGPWLAPFFASPIAICCYVGYVTPLESFGAAGVMIAIGLLLFVSVYMYREKEPMAFEQAMSAVPDLLETPACSRLNTPCPSQAGGSVYAGSIYSHGHTEGRDEEGGTSRTAPIQAFRTPAGSQEQDEEFLFNAFMGGTPRGSVQSGVKVWFSHRDL